MEDPSYRELMNYAMRALSHRAHTTHELAEKLKKRPHHSPERESLVLARLLELGLLNDDAFIQRTIEEATQFRLQGPLKVASRLYKRGISMKQTQEIWRSSGISERELAEEALKRAHKRFDQAEGKPRLSEKKLYQRKAQFLASRGFSPDIIYSLSSQAIEE